MLLINCHRVKSDQVERLRAWLLELNERVDEVRQTFVQETVRHEQGIILQGAEGPILIYAIEAEDLEAGRQAYEASTLPIDFEHRRIMDAVLDGPADVERIYDMSL